MFAIPGDGRYGIRPIFVEDMAQLLADAAEEKSNTVLNAVGPETFSFEELVRQIAWNLGRAVRLVHVPIAAAYVSTLVAGAFLRDVVLTWEEYQGLVGNLLAPEGAASGQTRLSRWLSENRDSVGKQYASEVARHFAPSRMLAGGRSNRGGQP